MRPLRWGYLLNVLVLCAATSVSAARLELLERTIDKELPPERNQVDPPLQMSSQFVPEVEEAEFAVSFQVFQSVELRTTDPSCNESFGANFSGTVIVTLEPEVGENTGDPVTVCFTETFSRRTTASGGSTASATIGGLQGVGPNTIIVNPGEANERVVLSFGPDTVDQDRGGAVNAFGHAFSARIGDVIDLRVGARVQVSCDGAGDAFASHLTFVELRTDGCQATAPTASYGGLAALALLLATLGLVALRHRADQ